MSKGRGFLRRDFQIDPGLIKDVIKPYKEAIVGIVVESTYNWYWLVDALMEEGYKVHLQIRQPYSSIRD